MFKTKARNLWKGLLLIAVLLVTIPTWAAPIKVSGRVNDTNGEPLMGVTIKEKGTNNVAITDINGNYTISCTTAKPVLVAQYVGFKATEKKVQGTLCDLILNEDVGALDEVVVTGYTTQKRCRCWVHKAP